VFDLALNGVGEARIERGEGIDGEGTWSLSGGFPLVGYVGESGSGACGRVCGVNVGVFNQEEVEVVVSAAFFDHFGEEAIGRAVMAGGVSEGERGGDAEYPRGVGVLHAFVDEERGGHVGKRKAKMGKLGRRGAGKPI
jgi:hypothetical protein